MTAEELGFATRRARGGLAVLVALTVLIGAFVSWPDPATAQPPRPRVIVVGVPGLAWEHVEPDRAPALAGLAAQGSLGSLSVRAATAATRRYDGWVTFAAGNRARARTAKEGSKVELPPEGQERLPDPVTLH
ncbi:MAG TPA: hypothetical protein VNB94_00885, partial [Mycobacteriales bacterium]|nr:hypothetical protein [Mycobacteriales bacterium]